MKIIEGIKLYDYEDLSQLLGIAVQSVRHWVKRAGIEARIIGRRKYITETELRQILEGVRSK